eukprot:TRINITY_DN2708_c0_g1_i6.p1 TRINITY_DN2708_c0_g1~~TRINITY_DN2708_c0_g1_i6.p1  ORF type:complete len:175 (+),score=4.49 TRINITY_DN2708_c0_g1_i6:25-549(+)
MHATLLCVKLQLQLLSAYRPVKVNTLHLQPGWVFFFFLMIRRPPRSTHCISSAASDVYKRQLYVSWLSFLFCFLVLLLLYPVVFCQIFVHFYSYFFQCFHTFFFQYYFFFLISRKRASRGDSNPDARFFFYLLAKSSQLDDRERTETWRRRLQRRPGQTVKMHTDQLLGPCTLR